MATKRKSTKRAATSRPSKKKTPASDPSTELRAVVYFGERQDTHIGIALEVLARTNALLLTNHILLQTILVNMGASSAEVAAHAKATYGTFHAEIVKDIESMIREHAPSADEILGPSPKE